MGSGRIGRMVAWIRDRIRAVLRRESGDLLTESMLGTIVASMAILASATGALMLAQIAVAFDQGVEQRQATTNAVTAAVAEYRASPLTASGKTVTVDGTKVKVWSSTVDGQTLYNGKPVKCLGPGCRTYSAPLPTVGAAAVGAMDTPYKVDRLENAMEFTLPAGKKRFFFAMEGVDGDDRISWIGTEQRADGQKPKTYAFKTGECAVEGCGSTFGGSVFGTVVMGQPSTYPLRFTISLRDPLEGPFELKPEDDIVIYTIPEGATP